MANSEDASIKQLYPADSGTSFTADTVELGNPFDLVADIEIGEQIFRVVDSLHILASIVNLSKSTVFKVASNPTVLTPANQRERRRVPVPVDPSWSDNVDPQLAVEDGDVLQCHATLKIKYGANVHYSHTQSGTFVAIA